MLFVYRSQIYDVDTINFFICYVVLNIILWLILDLENLGYLFLTLLAVDESMEVLKIKLIITTCD